MAVIKCVASIDFFVIFINWNGQNQTNCKEIHCPKSPQKATCCPENRQEVCPPRLRRQEAPQVQTRNRRIEIDQEISEKRKNFLHNCLRIGSWAVAAIFLLFSLT